MTLIFALMLIAAGVATFYVLVRNGFTDPVDVIGWVGASLCAVGGLIAAAGYIAEHGIGVDGDNARQVATFIVIVGLIAASVVGALQLAKRQRNAPIFDDRTQEPQRNYVPRQAQTMAYGTYTRADVQAERAKAQRIRKGVKA